MNAVPTVPLPWSAARSLKLGTVLLLISAGASLSGCHKEEPPKPPPATTQEVTPPPVVVPTKPSVEPAKPAVVVPVPAPKEVAPSAEMQQRVTAFKAFHPYSTASELFKISPFTAPLSSLLKNIANDPKLVDRILSSGKMAVESKPFSGTPKLDLKIDHSTPALTDGLLGAVLSGDPAQFVDFVLGGVQNAKVEYIVLPAKNSSTPSP